MRAQHWFHCDVFAEGQGNLKSREIAVNEYVPSNSRFLAEAFVSLITFASWPDAPRKLDDVMKPENVSRWSELQMPVRHSSYRKESLDLGGLSPLNIPHLILSNILFLAVTRTAVHTLSIAN